MIKEIIKIMVLIFLAIAVTTCGDDPVTPPELQPGSRDYTWEVDTLHIDNENIELFSIWGYSSEDIWAAGEATSSRYKLWHYDGNQWSTDSVGRILWGNIYGFSNNDIWIVGERAMWHYDGNEWIIFQDLTITGKYQNGLSKVWGKRTNDIYVFGYKHTGDYSEIIGAIFHFGGTEWKEIAIPKISGVFTIGYKDNNGWLYLDGIAYDGATKTYYAEVIWGYDGKEIKEIYSSTDHSSILSYMNGEVYCTIQNKIYKVNDGKMELWKDFTANGYLGMVEGRNENDFFGRGFEGLKHYNGSDLKLIYHTNSTIFDIQVFDNEVFCLAQTEDYKMLVIHGILE